MIETKYIIMIGIIVSLLTAYYLWDELSKINKIVIPNYQKTSQLEARLVELERQYDASRINNNLLKLPKKPKQIDSPAFSITYQSDIIAKKNDATVHSELSETEIDNIRKQLRTNNPDNKLRSTPCSSDKLKNKSPTKTIPKSSESYQQILDNLESTSIDRNNSPSKKNYVQDEQEDMFSSIFDSEVVKCISDSVNQKSNITKISKNKKINKTLPIDLLHKKNKK